MAAPRTSDFYSDLYYETSRRGRSGYGDIGWEMFPQKTEITDIEEDPENVYYHNRTTLMDRTPENSRMFPEEQPRRNTHAKEKIELRMTGARTGTDAWKNDGFDIQHYDKDPRGWSTEQPWDEYKRQASAHIRRTDFKSDADYSVPESGIHPNTMYKNIRQTQNWFKDHFKNFDTGYTNRHTGGVGTYDNISDVFKSEHENSSVMIDGKRSEFDDPVIHLNTTRILSNWVHGGSKALRNNTTSDHKVKVASYGKLLRQRGLIPMESQKRIVEDDTNWTKIGGMSNDTRNLVKLMSSIVEGKTATETEREFRQKFGETPESTERYTNGKYQQNQNKNVNNILTKDIMSLLGITETEIKFLESKSLKNDKKAKQAIADLFKMTKYIHSLPVTEKRKIKQELILKAAGGGLKQATPDGIRKNLDKSVINPKIIRTLKDVTKSRNMIFENMDNKNVITDPENKLKKILSDDPMYISKRKKYVMASTGHGTTGEAFAQSSKKTHSYKNISKYDKNIMKNRESSATDNLFLTAKTIVNNTQKPKFNEDITGDLYKNTTIDNNFGENKYLNRFTGIKGTKRVGLNQETSTEFFNNEFTRTNNVKHVKV